MDMILDGDEVNLFVPHQWQQVFHLQFNESVLETFPTKAELG